MQGQLNINILGQTFTLETQGDVKRAQQAADLLTDKLTAASKALDDGAGSVNRMGVLVLAALDIAHSYLEMRECHQGFLNQVGSRSERLLQRLETAPPSELHVGGR